MRADERAALAEIERNKRINKNISSGIKTVAGIAATSAAAPGIVNQAINNIVPFLSTYLTPEMALRGINKINPNVGNFLKKGQKMGLDLKGGLDFLRNKILPEEQQQTDETEQNVEQQQVPKSANENPIEALVPDLHTHIIQQVSKGMNPLDALHSAKTAALQPQIELIAKKLGPKLFDALTRFYSPEALGIAAPESKTALHPAGQAFENIPPQEPPMQQQNQPGSGAQALMAILQKINQKRGGQS